MQGEATERVVCWHSTRYAINRHEEAEELDRQEKERADKDDGRSHR